MIKRLNLRIKKQQMLTKEEFLCKVEKVEAMTSIKGKKYTNVVSNNKIVFFLRESGAKWEINLDRLYDIYKNENYFDTAVIKSLTGGRVNSPSIALLR